MTIYHFSEAQLEQQKLWGKGRPSVMATKAELMKRLEYLIFHSSTLSQSERDEKEYLKIKLGLAVPIANAKRLPERDRDEVN